MYQHLLLSLSLSLSVQTHIQWRLSPVDFLISDPPVPPTDVLRRNRTGSRNRTEIVPEWSVRPGKALKSCMHRGSPIHTYLHEWRLEVHAVGFRYWLLGKGVRRCVRACLCGIWYLRETSRVIFGVCIIAVDRQDVRRAELRSHWRCAHHHRGHDGGPGTNPVGRRDHKLVAIVFQVAEYEKTKEQKRQHCLI